MRQMRGPSSALATLNTRPRSARLIREAVAFNTSRDVPGASKDWPGWRLSILPARVVGAGNGFVSMIVSMMRYCGF